MPETELDDLDRNALESAEERGYIDWWKSGRPDHVLRAAQASIERLRCELVATAGDAVRMHRMVPR